MTNPHFFQIAFVTSSRYSRNTFMHAFFRYTSVVYFDQQKHACACVCMVEHDKKHSKMMKKVPFSSCTWEAHERLIQHTSILLTVSKQTLCFRIWIPHLWVIEITTVSFYILFHRRPQWLFCSSNETNIWSKTQWGESDWHWKWKKYLKTFNFFHR